MLKKFLIKERENMNPIRFKINYIFTPIYLLTTVILFGIIGILLSIDEEKYKDLCLVLFGVFALSIVVLLASTPFILKKEIKIELSRHDFAIREELLQYNIRCLDYSKFGLSKDLDVVFDKAGLRVNNKDYLYEDFAIYVSTGNHNMRVEIVVDFILQSEDEKLFMIFNMDNDLLNVIVNYNLQIKNKKVLDYIINDKEKAFKEILSHGRIRDKIINKVL